MKIAKKGIIRIFRLAKLSITYITSVRLQNDILYYVNLLNVFQTYEMQNLNFYQEY